MAGWIDKLLPNTALVYGLQDSEASIPWALAAFRSVALPPGRHIVEFTYRPVSVRYGALLSAAGLVLVGLLVLSPSRQYAGLSDG